MPEMSPMWWTSLFMMFNMSLIFVMMMIYFYIYKTIKMNPQNPVTNKLWKWELTYSQDLIHQQV